MTKPDRIPLFPLEVVLLPSTPLPLHIFEPRYKIMIRRCIEEPVEFGMVLASDRNLASTGCTAEVTRTIREYPDGRMDILAEGRSVFRLTKLLQEREYHEGQVEYLTDTVEPCDAEQEAQLIAIFGQCHLLLFGHLWSEAEGRAGETIAYRMAARLPMDLLEKQALLEMRAEPARRAFLYAWLGKLLPVLLGKQRARQRAC